MSGAAESGFQPPRAPSNTNNDEVHISGMIIPFGWVTLGAFVSALVLSLLVILDEAMRAADRKSEATDITRPDGAPPTAEESKPVERSE